MDLIMQTALGVFIGAGAWSGAAYAVKRMTAAEETGQRARWTDTLSFVGILALAALFTWGYSQAEEPKRLRYDPVTEELVPVR